MINIQDIIPLLKPGYIARDKSGDIYWYEEEPYINGTVWQTVKPCHCESFKDFGCLKDIEKWTDDWTKSLIKVGENE